MDITIGGQIVGRTHAQVSHHLSWSHKELKNSQDLLIIREKRLLNM